MSPGAYHQVGPILQDRFNEGFHIRAGILIVRRRY